jgi:toxin ParE1/3/4
MRCFLSRKAEDDLEAIADYIATDNPKRALTYINEIRVRCSALLPYPEVAPLREEFGKGIRMLPFGRYLIFYTVQTDSIRIERILAGERLLSSSDFID